MVMKNISIKTKQEFANKKRAFRRLQEAEEDVKMGRIYKGELKKLLVSSPLFSLIGSLLK